VLLVGRHCIHQCPVRVIKVHNIWDDGRNYALAPYQLVQRRGINGDVVNCMQCWGKGHAEIVPDIIHQKPFALPSEIMVVGDGGEVRLSE